MIHQALLLVAILATSAVATQPDQMATLKASAENGIGDAQFQLAEQYDKVDHNSPEALSWYERAAQQGHTGALDHLCRFYIDGPDQNTKGMFWCQKAADKGVPMGLAVIGGALAKGAGGLKKDGAKALDYLIRADAAGEVEGTLELGDMYIAGQFVPQDYGRSAGLFRKAMAKGSRTGAWALARQYELGLGFPVEANEAGRLYFLSASDGFPLAQTWLSKHPEVTEESVAANRMSWFSQSISPLMVTREDSDGKPSETPFSDYFTEVMRAAYPVSSVEKDGNSNSTATIDCHWNTAGDLDNCLLLSETPWGSGYGALTIKIATTPFPLKDKASWATKVAGKSTRLTVDWGS